MDEYDAHAPLRHTCTDHEVITPFYFEKRIMHLCAAQTVKQSPKYRVHCIGKPGRRQPFGKNPQLKGIRKKL